MRKLLAVLICSLSTFVIAQTNMCQGGICTYAVAANYTQASNIANAKVMNVWHPIAGGPASLAGVASGADVNGNTVHYFWTTTGAAWQYHDAFDATTPRTWTQLSAMGTDILQLLIGGAGQIWKMKLSNTACSGGGHQVSQWNGSAWVDPPHNICADTASIASDGTLYALNHNGGSGSSAYYYNGSAFAAIQGGPYSTITAVDSCTADMGMANSYSLWQRYQCTGTAVQLINNNFFTQVPGKVAMIDGTRPWVQSANGATIQKMNPSGTWDTIVGPGTTLASINTCGFLCTFAVANGAPYWFNDISVTATVTLTGKTNCNGTCPPSVTHTPHVTAKFHHSLTGGQTVNGNPVNPQTQINLSAQDTTYDALDCFDSDNPIGCLTPTGGGASVGSVFCSLIAANVFDGNPSLPAGFIWQDAYSRVDNGSSQNCVAGTFSFQCGSKPSCFYDGPWVYECPALHVGNIPDYAPSYVSVCHSNNAVPPLPDPKIWGFDVWGKCVYPPSLPNSPFFCVYDLLGGGLGTAPKHNKMLSTDNVPKGTGTTCTIQGILE
jgi:hypothetical protein